jgi:hypothetical protein
MATGYTIGNKLIFLICALSLAACSTVPARTPALDWPAAYVRAARAYCLNGELPACQTYVGGGYGAPVIPTVETPNPFVCPGHAPSPASPAPRGEPSPP